MLCELSSALVHEGLCILSHEIQLTCSTVHFFADADNFVDLFFAQRLQDNDQLSLNRVSNTFGPKTASYILLLQRDILAL